jgi:hypothetical protein
MGRRIAVSALTFIAAFGVLFASILQSSSVKEVFSQAPSTIDTSIPKIDYQLPGTGAIGPEDPFWTLEVLRDRLWLTTTQDTLDRSQLLLLLANKRISYAHRLTEREDYEEAIGVSRKAEMYLLDAVQVVKEYDVQSADTLSHHEALALSALKHREILERMYSQAPDDARPIINEINNDAKSAFEQASHMLNDSKSPVPHNPFSF